MALVTSEPYFNFQNNSVLDRRKQNSFYSTVNNQQAEAIIEQDKYVKLIKRYKSVYRRSLAFKRFIQVVACTFVLLLLFALILLLPV